MKTEIKTPSTFRQNIYIKSVLGLDVFDLNIDRKETTYLISEMKKDPKFVCDYLVQKGAKIVNQTKFNKAIQGEIVVTNSTTDFYTIKEISEKLSVAGSTVLRWIQEGHLKAKKKDSRWIVEKEIFDKFREERFGENKETQKETAIESIREKTGGISQTVLMHLIQNGEIYASDFSINEVHKNIGVEKYKFEQINSALLNLSANKKTRETWVEKVAGRRGIFRLSKKAPKGSDQVAPAIPHSNATNIELSLPDEIIEDFVSNFKGNTFSILDICDRYPKAKRNSVAKALQKGHRLIKKLGRGAYAPIQTEQTSPNEQASLPAMVTTKIDSISDIKSAIRILKNMDKNITVQNAMSILAEKLCEII